MSSQRPVEATGKTSNPIPPLTKEQREALKAKLVKVVDRGHALDRIRVDLPDDMYGEWCPDDPYEIRRYINMGFKIDTEYAAKYSHFNSGADGRAIYGDTVFMVAPKYIKELIDEIRQEEFIRMHGRPNVVNRNLKEEVEAQNKAEFPITNTSHAESINAEQLANIILNK